MSYYTGLLNSILHAGGDFAELFFEDKHCLNISFEDGKIRSVDIGNDRGVGVRVLKGLTTGYASTGDWSEASILRAAGRIQFLPETGVDGQTVATDRQATGNGIQPNFHMTEGPIRDKIDVLLEADEAARRFDAKIYHTTISYEEIHRRILITNSLGVHVEDMREYLRLTVRAYAERVGLRRMGQSGLGGCVGFGIFNKIVCTDIGLQAARLAVTFLQARPAPSGSMPVVMGPGMSGIMFHEACGHGLEADFIRKRSSVYTDRLGQRVASDYVTLIDDATLPRGAGSYRFDDEGTPAQRTRLIENGILESYLCDRLEAGRLRLPLTANGRRQSFRFPPQPRMSNTYLAPGDTSPEDILASVKSGLYVLSLGGGQVDVVSGDFAFGVSEGYFIDNGRIHYPVTGAVIVGNGPKILRTIAAVGNDLKMDTGLGRCGKGQLVPVSVGQPTILIPQITVGGSDVS